MDDTEVWTEADTARGALVALLEGLTPSDWAHPSLCEAWTVRDVAAHVSTPLLGMGRVLLLGLRHPGGTNTLIRESAKTLARRQSTEQITDNLRRMIGFHHHFTLTCREALIDILSHSLDIAIPLGLPLADELSVPALAEAADRVVSYGGKGSAKVFRRLDLGHVRLQATDTDWATGSGDLAAGSMRDVYLALTGRTVHLDRLRGPGADRLTASLAA